MTAVLEPARRLTPLHEDRLAQILDIEQRAYAFPWTEGIFRDCIKAGYSCWGVLDREGRVPTRSLANASGSGRHPGGSLPHSPDSARVPCREPLVAYAVMSMAVGEAHVLNLAVDPLLRRQGIARFLLSHLLQVARAAHSTIVLLEVRRSNKAAIRLYQGFGFAQIGTRRGYYPGHEQREDAFVLALDLA